MTAPFLGIKWRCQAEKCPCSTTAECNCWRASAGKPNCVMCGAEMVYEQETQPETKVDTDDRRDRSEARDHDGAGAPAASPERREAEAVAPQETGRRAQGQVHADEAEARGHGKAKRKRKGKEDGQQGLSLAPAVQGPRQVQGIEVHQEASAVEGRATQGVQAEAASPQAPRPEAWADEGQEGCEGGNAREAGETRLLRDGGQGVEPAPHENVGQGQPPQKGRQEDDPEQPGGGSNREGGSVTDPAPAPEYDPKDYSAFIARKSFTAPSSGFDPGLLHEAMFPYQRDIVRWALRKGRAAIFAQTGLGKTIMLLEFAKRVSEHTGGRVLILSPLAVSKQTQREGERFGYTAFYAKNEMASAGAPIVLTNYERSESFDVSQYAGIVLDESSILKSFDGKTRVRIVESFSKTPYRLACTATPAPNDHTELGNHAEFLGIMTRAEMLAMFFVHDGGDTSKWDLKGHAKEHFWKWVASWGCVVRRPSDVNETYSDESHELPPISFTKHIVAATADQTKAMGLLFAEPVQGLNAQRGARRATMTDRVKIAADLANADSEPWLIWCGLNDEGDAITEAVIGAQQVAGKDSDEDKETRLFGFIDGRPRVLVSKSKIAGHGMNWQHCRNVAFVGVSHSFEEFFQSVRRCYRFGQKRDVRVHIISSELEGAVVDNLQRKESQAQEMGDEMAVYMRDTLRAEMREASVMVEQDYERDMREGEGWKLHLGDCVDVIKEMADASVDFSIFSPPFSSLYTYSDLMRDFGNCRSHDEFAEHMGHLVPDLLRVTKPGRLLAFHCMQIPTMKSRDGYIGLLDFRGVLIKAFQDTGWIYHSEVCIWKDPVVQMQRTKALGLLHKQVKKDSAMSRMGLADYLVVMRKPGDNVSPISHTADEFPVEMWQRYASPVWSDINPSDTLQHRSVKEDEDTRHICPIQLDVVRRALMIWTNPGDLVLSPFTGIGSEGYVALQEGRRFIGAELKRSYWEQACKNLESMAKGTKKQLSLLDAMPEASEVT